jgi:3-hydroxybutyryl-CoA dehydrogenase
MNPESIRRVLVFGAGSMGEGISQVFAQAGLDVRLVDIDQSALDRCRGQVRANLELMHEFELLSRSPAEVFSRIGFHQVEDMNAFAPVLDGVDVVVEAVPEILELKQTLFGALDMHCAPEVILCSNTSSLTISEISRDLAHRQRIAGLHFLFPAHIVPLVEIHGGPDTAAQTLATIKELMLRVDKRPIVVKKELPGFIVNRIQAAYNREITYLLDQGVASAEDLDEAAVSGFGFRLACMGPLAIHDLNGLDVVMKAGGKTRQSICNDRGHSASLLKKVEKGELGIKTGKGWHDYEGQTREALIDAANRKLLRQLALFKAREKERNGA